MKCARKSGRTSSAPTFVSFTMFAPLQKVGADSVPQMFLFGYFGANNFGDEWTLASFLKGAEGIGLKREQISVISRNPDKTRNEHGIVAVPRIWKAILSRISKCQVIVGCGGSLLQDVTSFRSLAFYCLLIWVAKIAGKKVALLGQGLGPLKRPLSKTLARRAINACDLVTFRERESLKLAKGLGCKLDNCFLTADITFAWDEIPKRQLTSSIAVNLRPVKKHWSVVNLTEALKRITREGEKILLLPLQPQVDENTLLPLAKILSSRWHRYETWRDGLVGVASCKLLLAMRLHALIAACILGVPFVGLNYDPKVANILGEVAVGQILPLSAGVEEIASAVERVRLKDAKTFSERLTEFASNQKSAAERNFEFLVEKVLV